MTDTVLHAGVARPARAATGMTRPQRIVAGMVVVATCLMASAGVVVAVVPAWQASVRVIGFETEPSIAAALRMRTALSDMDADALSDAVADNGSAIATSNSYREAAATLDGLLLDTGKVAGSTGMDGTKKALVTEMQRFLRLYSEALGEARWAGFSAGYLGATRAKWASQLLNSAVRPPAEELDAVSSDALNREFQAFSANAGTRVAELAGIAAVPLLCLLALQLSLAHRSRRVLNVPLAAATLVAAVTAGWLVFSAVRVQDDVRTAWQNDFGTVYGLQYARMNAHDIRAKRALWLFDPTTREAADSDTADLVELLLGIPRPPRPGAPPVVDIGRPSSGLFGNLLDWTGGLRDSHGSLERARELLVTYLQTGDTMHKLEKAGRHVEAADFGLGTAPDQGGTVFRAMEGALADALSATEARFAAHVEDALRLTEAMPAAALEGFGLAMLLALFGLWQRYRVFL